MIALLVLALLAVPVVELWLIIEVAAGIGLVPTLVLLVAVSIAGAWLLRREGTKTWWRLQDALRRGEVPGREISDGALILFGGALLLTPGFLTDAVGLVLVIPPTRSAVKATAWRALRFLLERRFPVARAGRRVYAARVVGVRRDDATTTPPSPSAPLEEGRADEGGSRDRA